MADDQIPSGPPAGGEAGGTGGEVNSTPAAVLGVHLEADGESSRKARDEVINELEGMRVQAKQIGLSMQQERAAQDSVGTESFRRASNARINQSKVELAQLQIDMAKQAAEIKRLNQNLPPRIMKVKVEAVGTEALEVMREEFGTLLGPLNGVTGRISSLAMLFRNLKNVAKESFAEIAQDTAKGGALNPAPIPVRAPIKQADSAASMQALADASARAAAAEQLRVVEAQKALQADEEAVKVAEARIATLAAGGKAASDEAVALQAQAEKTLAAADAKRVLYEESLKNTSLSPEVVASTKAEYDATIKQADADLEAAAAANVKATAMLNAANSAGVKGAAESAELTAARAALQTAQSKAQASGVGIVNSMSSAQSAELESKTLQMAAAQAKYNEELVASIPLLKEEIANSDFLIADSKARLTNTEKLIDQQKKKLDLTIKEKGADDASTKSISDNILVLQKQAKAEIEVAEAIRTKNSVNSQKLQQAYAIQPPVTPGQTEEQVAAAAAADKAATTARRMQYLVAGARVAANTIAALGATMVVTDIAATHLASTIAHEASDFEKLGEQVGLSAKEVQQFSVMGKVVGVNTGEMIRAFGQFDHNVLAKQTGANLEDGDLNIQRISQSRKVIAALGVEIETADGRMRNAKEIVADLADKFTQLHDGPVKAAAAIELFTRTGINMIPVLNQGKEGFKEWDQIIEEFGPEMSDKLVKSADDFDKAEIKMDLSWQKFKEHLVDLGFLERATKFVDMLAHALNGLSSALDALGGTNVSEAMDAQIKAGGIKGVARLTPEGEARKAVLAEEAQKEIKNVVPSSRDTLSSETYGLPKGGLGAAPIGFNLLGPMSRHFDKNSALGQVTGAMGLDIDSGGEREAKHFAEDLAQKIAIQKKYEDQFAKEVQDSITNKGVGPILVPDPNDPKSLANPDSSGAKPVPAPLGLTKEQADLQDTGAANYEAGVKKNLGTNKPPHDYSEQFRSLNVAMTEAEQKLHEVGTAQKSETEQVALWKAELAEAEPVLKKTTDAVRKLAEAHGGGKFARAADATQAAIGTETDTHEQNIAKLKAAKAAASTPEEIGGINNQMVAENVRYDLVLQKLYDTLVKQNAVMRSVIGGDKAYLPILKALEEQINRVREIRAKLSESSHKEESDSDRLAAEASSLSLEYSKLTQKIKESALGTEDLAGRSVIAAGELKQAESEVATARANLAETGFKSGQTTFITKEQADAFKEYIKALSNVESAVSGLNAITRAIKTQQEQMEALRVKAGELALSYEELRVKEADLQTGSGDQNLARQYTLAADQLIAAHKKLGAADAELRAATGKGPESFKDIVNPTKEQTAAMEQYDHALGQTVSAEEKLYGINRQLHESTLSLRSAFQAASDAASAFGYGMPKQLLQFFALLDVIKKVTAQIRVMQQVQDAKRERQGQPVKFERKPPPTTGFRGWMDKQLHPEDHVNDDMIDPGMSGKDPKQWHKNPKTGHWEDQNNQRYKSPTQKKEEDAQKKAADDAAKKKAAELEEQKNSPLVKANEVVAEALKTLQEYVGKLTTQVMLNTDQLKKQGGGNGKSGDKTDDNPDQNPDQQGSQANLDNLPLVNQNPDFKQAPSLFGGANSGGSGSGDGGGGGSGMMGMMGSMGGGLLSNFAQSMGSGQGIGSSLANVGQQAVSMIPVAGPIISAGIGIFKGVFGMFQAKTAKHIEHVVNAIKNSAQSIVAAVGSGDLTLVAGLQELQEQRTAAINQLGGPGQSPQGKQQNKALADLLPQLDTQISQLEAQAKGIKVAFNEAFEISTLPQGIQDIGQQIEDLNKKVRDFVNAGGDAAEATQYLNNQLNAMKVSIGQDLLNTEQQTIQSLLQEIDLRKQKADIVAQEAQSEASIMNQGVRSRSRSTAQDRAEQIQQLRLDRDQKLRDANQQLQELQVQVGAKQQIFGLSNDQLTLENQLLQVDQALGQADQDRVSELMKVQALLPNTVAQPTTAGGVPQLGVPNSTITGTLAPLPGTQPQIDDTAFLKALMAGNPAYGDKVLTNLFGTIPPTLSLDQMQMIITALETGNAYGKTLIPGMTAAMTQQQNQQDSYLGNLPSSAPPVPVIGPGNLPPVNLNPTANAIGAVPTTPIATPITAPITPTTPTTGTDTGTGTQDLSGGGGVLTVDSPAGTSLVSMTQALSSISTIQTPQVTLQAQNVNGIPTASQESPVGTSVIPLISPPSGPTVSATQVVPVAVVNLPDTTDTPAAAAPETATATAVKQFSATAESATKTITTATAAIAAAAPTTAVTTAIASGGTATASAGSTAYTPDLTAIAQQLSERSAVPLSDGVADRLAALIQQENSPANIAAAIQQVVTATGTVKQNPNGAAGEPSPTNITGVLTKIQDTLTQGPSGPVGKLQRPDDPIPGLSAFFSYNIQHFQNLVDSFNAGNTTQADALATMKSWEQLAIQQATSPTDQKYLQDTVQPLYDKNIAQLSGSDTTVSAFANLSSDMIAQITKFNQIADQFNTGTLSATQALAQVQDVAMHGRGTTANDQAYFASTFGKAIGDALGQLLPFSATQVAGGTSAGTGTPAPTPVPAPTTPALPPSSPSTISPGAGIGATTFGGGAAQYQPPGAVSADVSGTVQGLMKANPSLDISVATSLAQKIAAISDPGHRADAYNQMIMAVTGGPDGQDKVLVPRSDTGIVDPRYSAKGEAEAAAAVTAQQSAVDTLWNQYTATGTVEQKPYQAYPTPAAGSSLDLNTDEATGGPTSLSAGLVAALPSPKYGVNFGPSAISSHAPGLPANVTDGYAGGNYFQGRFPSVLTKLASASDITAALKAYSPVAFAPGVAESLGSQILAKVMASPNPTVETLNYTVAGVLHDIQQKQLTDNDALNAGVKAGNPSAIALMEYYDAGGKPPALGATDVPNFTAITPTLNETVGAMDALQNLMVNAGLAPVSNLSIDQNEVLNQQLPPGWTGPAPDWFKGPQLLGGGTGAPYTNPYPGPVTGGGTDTGTGGGTAGSGTSTGTGGAIPIPLPGGTGAPGPGAGAQIPGYVPPVSTVPQPGPVPVGGFPTPNPILPPPPVIPLPPGIGNTGEPPPITFPQLYSLPENSGALTDLEKETLLQYGDEFNSIIQQIDAGTITTAVGVNQLEAVQRKVSALSSPENQSVFEAYTSQMGEIIAKVQNAASGKSQGLTTTSAASAPTASPTTASATDPFQNGMVSYPAPPPVYSPSAGGPPVQYVNGPNGPVEVVGAPVQGTGAPGVPVTPTTPVVFGNQNNPVTVPATPVSTLPPPVSTLPTPVPIPAPTPVPVVPPSLPLVPVPSPITNPVAPVGPEPVAITPIAVAPTPTPLPTNLLPPPSGRLMAGTPPQNPKQGQIFTDRLGYGWIFNNGKWDLHSSPAVPPTGSAWDPAKTTPTPTPTLGPSPVLRPSSVPPRALPLDATLTVATSQPGSTGISATGPTNGVFQMTVDAATASLTKLKAAVDASMQLEIAKQALTKKLAAVKNAHPENQANPTIVPRASLYRDFAESAGNALSKNFEAIFAKTFAPASAALSTVAAASVVQNASSAQNISHVQFGNIAITVPPNVGSPTQVAEAVREGLAKAVRDMSGHLPATFTR